MRRVVVLAMVAVLAVALLTLAGCGAKKAEVVTTPRPKTTSAGPTGQIVEVTMKNFAFDPQEKTIKAGTTVSWMNNDSMTHTITGPDWDSGQIPPGVEYRHTFPLAGTFDYRCTIHPQMTGKIIVQ